MLETLLHTKLMFVCDNIAGADVAFHPPCPPRLLAQGFPREAVAGKTFLLSREILIIYVQIAVKCFRAENRTMKANTKSENTFFTA